MAPQPLSLTLTAFIIFFSLILTSSAADDDHQFEFMDVAAALNQARQVFSPPNTPSTTVLPQQQLDGSPSLSLTIHPRHSLPSARPTTANYTALTLSRLARDQSRVHSLLLRHSLSLSRSSASEFSPQQFQSPVTSGIRLGSGEYFARIGVGRPSKDFYMVVDTGSDISWLQCQPCSTCYDQADPIFNPSASASYRPLPCAAPQCSALEVSACRTDSCLYQVSYGDGSYTVGNFATETVTFGATGSVPNVAIGCGHHNEGLFAGAAGLLGLGGGTLSLNSQIKAASFSYCLVNRDSSSSSTLEFNSARASDAVLAPLLTNPRINTYHFVALNGINVGGRPVNFSPDLLDIGGDGRGGVIIDSGTAVTRLRSEVYNSVRDAFAGMARDLPAASGFSLFDTCYDLSRMTTVRVPTVSLQFAGGKAVPLRPSNFLIPVDDAGKYCFAFAATSGSLSIIGNVQQQGTRVSYDLANKVVGFSPNKC
ncbi:protein ASPARTIC PROTEASE IN GUARD CELL 1-like [Salvia splendens]|uniref:protein ASPARTIC PROTEASE IN GUARD CELL 1-like n=1 Tax=Salvia splendens TaxID=180675 RepID=UPI001C255D07|nr:protein ASPARTIC PROTEASE IN GUARD CELL 1-like [Salvia splendens]